MSLKMITRQNRKSMDSGKLGHSSVSSIDSNTNKDRQPRKKKDVIEKPKKIEKSTPKTKANNHRIKLSKEFQSIMSELPVFKTALFRSKTSASNILSKLLDYLKELQKIIKKEESHWDEYCGYDIGKCKTFRVINNLNYRLDIMISALRDRDLIEKRYELSETRSTTIYIKIMTKEIETDNICVIDCFRSNKKWKYDEEDKKMALEWKDKFNELMKHVVFSTDH